MKKILQEEIKKIATLYSRNYSKTLEEMKKHDYFKESITGISTEKTDDKILKENLKQFGELISKGMPTIEYKNAMNYQWQDMTEYNKETNLINIDISKIMNYNTYVQTLKELSRYDGVYAGSYGGSANETKAMMKWFYHYIVEEKAVYYLDYHQQKRVIYAGCNWQTKEQFNESMKFVENLQTVIRTNNGDTYTYEPEELYYGLKGEGSAATLEIGEEPNYLGYSDNTRYLIANEYFDYNFDKLLEKLPTFIK